MRYALGVTYEGSHYHGWQSQNDNLPTIQKAIETAISRVADHPVNIICAGRTDKGVHALGQVVHFDTTAERVLYSWLLGINSNLPRDVRVTWVQPVNDEFHARFSAQARKYRYVIYNNLISSALLRHQSTWFHEPLDAALMNTAGAFLLGEHDFSSYRAAECQAKSPIRTLYELTVTRQGKFVILEVHANGFLHHMVRNIAGVLMVIGAGKQDPVWAKTILEVRDRKLGGVTADASGLYLTEVTYPEEFSIPAPETSFIC